MVSPRHPTTMENLPGEVLSKIFIRLLAKQLTQMRCVCKPWNALLSKSSFVKSHLQHSIDNNDEILLFFRWGFSFDCRPFTARPSSSPNLELTNFIKLPVNPQSRICFGSVIGSVNGLICFNNGSYDADCVLHIWNPSLSAILTLPPCSLPFRQLRFGFGFDPRADDYKVVKVTSFFPVCNRLPQAEVYSMRKGSWESISQRFPSHISRIWDQNQVCVDGHLHWLGATDFPLKPQTIVAFDLGADTFSEIPLPDSIIRHHGYNFNVLGVLGGKLCVMSRVGDGEWEMWVMDEYGVAKSWVKNQVFPPFGGGITPYGLTSHNELLFRFNDNNDRFALYDPIAAKTKFFKIMLRHIYIGQIIEYVDSLVWVAPASRLHI